MVNENQSNKPLVYLAGDIMTKGSQLAREYELFSFRNENINAEVYSPAMNKDINDKSAMTEEQNNVLAEKITEEDIKRLWNSDIVAICPEQSAIGTMCELGTLYGWKVAAAILQQTAEKIEEEIRHDENITEEQFAQLFLMRFGSETLSFMRHILSKDIYAHYFDIRTNHLNEKDWRRSFSINQMLYGMILYCTKDHTLHSDFKEILPLIKESANKEETSTEAANAE
jgi:nucleoside 2-deoxyribosyltransferase